TQVADGLRYQPEAGFYGADRFTYTIQNSAGEQDTAQVRITVLAEEGVVEAASIAQAAPRAASNVVRNHREAVSLFLEGGSYASLNEKEVARRSGPLGGAAGDGGLTFGGAFLSVNSRNGEQDAGSANNGELQKGYDDNLTGFTVGADALWGNNWVAGAALGLSQSRVEFADGAGDFEMDDASVLGFASYRDDALTVQAQLGYSELDYSFEFADSAGNNRFAFVKGQYAFNKGGWQFIPGLSFNYQSQFVDAYIEQQTPANPTPSSFSSQKTRSLRGGLSLHIDRAINFNWGVFLPRFAVTAEQVISSGQHGINGYSGGQEFELAATEGDNSQMLVDLGASFVMPRGWAVFFNLQSLLLLEDYSSNAVQLGTRKEF
ncbi:MAG TPA: autotransporter domain-containing protein, partial [Marinagarivorans sp.]